MADDAQQEADALPEAFVRVLGDYEQHLAVERDLTPHSVRAYLTDVAGLLEHARRLGLDDVARLDLRTLRSWLAQQQSLGRSRTTIARRATAARVFTAWLARTGRAEHDAGASLASPKAHRTLPPVLRRDEADDLIRAATELADDGSPVGLRDVAMLELLYATGIRVGELVGLDVDDVDRERNVVRVLGKGRKERSVPFGRPAAHALDFWTRHGRPLLVVDGSGPALFLGARGGRIDQRAVRTLVHRRIAEVPGAPDIGPARAAAHRRHPPAGGRRRPALGAGAAGPRLAGHHPALHARHHRPAASGVPAGPPTRLTPTRRYFPPSRREFLGTGAGSRGTGAGSRSSERSEAVQDRPVRRVDVPEASQARGGESGGGGGPEGEQADRAQADQPQGVEVGLARRPALDPAPVQAGAWQAVRRRDLEPADDLAGGHRLAHRKVARDRLVRRARRPVGDHDDAAARDPPHEGDLARERRAHRLAGPAQQVDAAVAGSVGRGRGVEAGDHLGGGAQRPGAHRIGLGWRGPGRARGR